MSVILNAVSDVFGKTPLSRRPCPFLTSPCSCTLRQFGGYAKEADYITQAAQLRTALEGTATYRSDIYFCTGYDPPMKPYGRRNEVWLVKKT